MGAIKTEGEYSSSMLMRNAAVDSLPSTETRQVCLGTMLLMERMEYKVFKVQLVHKNRLALMRKMEHKVQQGSRVDKGSKVHRESEAW